MYLYLVITDNYTKALFTGVNTSGSISLAEEYPKVSTTTTTNTLPGFSRLPTGFHANRSSTYSLPNTSIYGDWAYNSVDQYAMNGTAQRNRPMSAAASLSASKKNYNYFFNFRITIINKRSDSTNAFKMKVF